MVTSLAIENHRPRIADKMPQYQLAYAGAAEIRGQKWHGKTEAAPQPAASAIMMQNPDERANNLALAETKPSLLLGGAKPRLIDEWQEAPQLRDAVRFAVDRECSTGNDILTGSATPYAKPSHSGTGRFAFLDMLPMPLFESGDSTGEASLAALFARTADISSKADSNAESIACLTCREGWPKAATIRQGDVTLETAFDYLDAIAEEDISRADGVSRNAQHARVIMQECARISSTRTTQASIRRDIKASRLLRNPRARRIRLPPKRRGVRHTRHVLEGLVRCSDATKRQTHAPT